MLKHEHSSLKAEQNRKRCGAALRIPREIYLLTYALAIECYFEDLLSVKYQMLIKFYHPNISRPKIVSIVLHLKCCPNFLIFPHSSILELLVRLIHQKIIWHF